MLEQKHFPAYRPEDPKNRLLRASLMLTHEQILLIASALRLLDSILYEKNPLKKLFTSPLLSESEQLQLESIHNACINCAISQEAMFQTSQPKE